MKKIIIILMVLAVISVFSFGYSLRMNSLGRVNIALTDFESDLQRNPALITGLEKPYLKLNLGTTNAKTGYALDGWETVDYTWIEDQITESSSLPIGITGFYKVGNLSFGLQFDMPSGVGKNENLLNELNAVTGEAYDQITKTEIDVSAQNLSISAGYKLGSIIFGVNTGQMNFNRITTQNDFTKSVNGTVTINTYEEEGEETIEGTWYGFGAGYIQEKYSCDLSYKIFSYSTEFKMNKSITDGTPNDLTDFDAYPLENSEYVNTLIQFKGSYNLKSDWNVSMGMDVYSGESLIDTTDSTHGKYRNIESERDYTNYVIGVGKEAEELRIGCELGLMQVEEMRNLYAFQGTTFFKVQDVTIDFVLYQIRAGFEYDLSDKFTVRAGGVKYLLKDRKYTENIYILTDLLESINSELNDDRLNAYVVSFGVDYKIKQNISLTYGYQAGDYLYDDIYATLKDSNYYINEINDNYSGLSQNTKRIHKVAAKYEF